MREDEFVEAVSLLRQLLADKNDELVQTRSLLHEVMGLLKEEKLQHAHDISELRSSCISLFKHHDEEMSETHKLLRSSEERIASTNTMVRHLSDSCNSLVEVNRDLKDSYLMQFDRTTAICNHLQEEVAKLTEEKTAYFESVKNYRSMIEDMRRKYEKELAESRKRYDELMDRMCKFIFDHVGNHSSLVNIDQKPK